MNCCAARPPRAFPPVLWLCSQPPSSAPGFSSDAVWVLIAISIDPCLGTCITFAILLQIKPPQQHYGVLPEQSPIHRVRRVDREAGAVSQPASCPSVTQNKGRTRNALSEYSPSRRIAHSRTQNTLLVSGTAAAQTRTSHTARPSHRDLSTAARIAGGCVASRRLR